MTAINVSSLASSLTGTTFDWQSFVDTMITYQSATITTLQAEQSVNSDKVSALQILETDLKELQSANTALKADGLFTGRTAASSTAGSTWKLTADSGATVGSYDVNVTQLATASQRAGASGISQSLNDTDDVSSLTIASASTSTAITAGTLTINGAQINVALTDSLQDVFDKICAATGNDVVATYNHDTDKVTLSSKGGSEIILGATNDSSNFFSALKLSNNGTGATTSSNALGAVKTTAKLANAGFATAISGPNSATTGTFAINGITISFDTAADSLNDVISRINASSAGVTASYDAGAERMILVNNATGDTGFGLSDTSGNFLEAVGLTTGGTTTRGKNAQFSINGGSTLSSASNNLTSTVTGLKGLNITANSLGAQTVVVSANTDAMKTAIQNFVDKYNIVQSYIETQTSITVKGGTVTTSTLSGNREVDYWASNLRSKVFSSVSGLSGTISRLADLGIDFNQTSSQLTVKDSSKLTHALETNPSDVESFFKASGTGFVSRVDTYLSSLLSADGTSSGIIAKMEDNLTSSNASISNQIKAIQARLETQREQMLTAFQAMQAAQQNAKSMITALNNTLKTNNSNN